MRRTYRKILKHQLCAPLVHVLPSIRLPDRVGSIRFLVESATYRIERPVTQIVQYPTYGHCYPLCPRCKRSLEREYVSFCDCCGQKLNWDRIDDAKILVAPIIE